MSKYHASHGERGQAIVILVLAMIVLLGFAGLAIDGGNLYAQRRHAQAAVDNAALAYGLAMSREETQVVAEDRAEQVLINNGYTDPENWTAANSSPGDVDVIIAAPAGNTIQITLTATIKTAFIHLVYRGPAAYTVTAKAKGTPPVYPFAGYGIVSLRQCSGDGATDANVGSTGGGNTGGINVYNGGIVANLPIPASANCGFHPPNNGSGITATGGVCNVGSETDFGGNMDQVTPNCNDGEALTDPMGPLNDNPPVCNQNGSFSGGKWQPGKYDNDPATQAPEPGWGTYAPGIYCIEGGINPSGNGTITGSGVLFYFISGGIDLQGQGSISISGPSCPRTSEPENPCTYPNLVMYSKPGNTSTFDIGGNGGSNITGTIYLPDGTLDASGGGSNPQETVVTGQIIAWRVLNNGNGSLRLIYDESKMYVLPPTMQLVE